MNKFYLASIIAVAIFIGIIFFGGFTESYATYYDQEVSFQYPSEWNVTKESTTVPLVYLLYYYDDPLIITGPRIVIYERSNEEMAKLTGWMKQTGNYSDGGKVVTEYYLDDESTKEYWYFVQTGGKIFSVCGSAEDKQYVKRIADTLTAQI